MAQGHLFRTYSCSPGDSYGLINIKLIILSACSHILPRIILRHCFWYAFGQLLRSPTFPFGFCAEHTVGCRVKIMFLCRVRTSELSKRVRHYALVRPTWNLKKLRPAQRNMVFQSGPCHPVPCESSFFRSSPRNHKSQGHGNSTNRRRELSPTRIEWECFEML